MKEKKSFKADPGGMLHRAMRDVILLSPSRYLAFDLPNLSTYPGEVRLKVEPGRYPSDETARCEWDFRAKFSGSLDHESAPFQFLEDAEILPCFYYEESRMRKDWEADVIHWRLNSNAKTFESYLRLWQRRASSGEKCPSYEFYVLWPEWPDMPYLSLPANVRRSRLEIWTGRRFRQASKPKRLLWEPPPLTTVSFNHLFAYVEQLRGRKRGLFPPYDDANVNGTISFSGQRHPRWKSREFVAFQIDWEVSNDQLIDGFRAWIETHRTEVGKKERELRGPASYSRMMRSELVALGAWRLVRKGGLKVEGSRTDREQGVRIDAIQFTERVSGKALYKDPLTWLRNLKKIEAPLGICFDQKSNATGVDSK